MKFTAQCKSKVPYNAIGAYVGGIDWKVSVSSTCDKNLSCLELVDFPLNILGHYGLLGEFITIPCVTV